MENRSFKVCETRNRLPNFDDSVETTTSVKTAKTDNSRRTVYIMDGLFQDFQNYQAIHYQAIQRSIQKQNPDYNPDGYVFCQENGQPYEPRTYQDLFKRCVRQARIADANLHSMRYTHASRALEQEIDVVMLSRLLGHATPSITRDKYGHALSDHKRASVEKLGDIYSSGYSFAPADQEMEEPQKQGYGFDFGMSF